MQAEIERLIREFREIVVEMQRAIKAIEIRAIEQNTEIDIDNLGNK